LFWGGKFSGASSGVWTTPSNQNIRNYSGLMRVKNAGEQEEYIKYCTYLWLGAFPARNLICGMRGRAISISGIADGAGRRRPAIDPKSASFEGM
jgi:hypothetical protein